MEKISDTVERKFVESFDVSEWEVETDGGWVDVEKSNKTIEYDVWRLELEDGKWLECADNHIVFQVTGIHDKDADQMTRECFVKDLRKGDMIQANGEIGYTFVKVKSVEKLDRKEHMYDLTVGGNHTYFTNDILSHNTLILGHSAMNAVKQGKNALYITFEIDEMEFRKRMDASFTDLNINSILKMRDQVKDKIREAKKDGSVGRFIIKEYPPASVSALEIESFLYSLKLKKDFVPDIIYLDYLGIMVPISKDAKNSYDRGKAVCEEIRALSDRFKCPILTAAQANRCLALDTEIMDEGGNIKVIKDVEVGDILTSNEGNVVVNKVYPTTKQKCYKIKTKSGKEIVCSGKHIFPTKDGEKDINNGLGKGDFLIID